jgi:DNA-binding beta-propeller fold protein YncE
MIKRIAIILLLAFSSLPLYCQEEGEMIRWVRQYPDENAAKEQGFFQKLDALVFGAKPVLMNKPVAIVTDDQNQSYILSQENGAVLKISDKKTVSLSDKLSKSNYSFPSLISMCLLPGKGLLFTDSYLNQAMLISEDEKKISSFTTSKGLDKPTGIAYSKATSQVWIIETGSHQISVFDRSGMFIKSIGQRGTETGEFNFPTHLWIDDQGIAYVVDAMNFRIQIFNKEGKFLSAFGKAGDTTGSFSRPKGIATDSHGNIYVADAIFSSIQIFNKEGDFLYHFGSRGTDKGLFWMPAGIFIDKKDNIYVSDSYNNRVQVFQLIKEKK